MRNKIKVISLVMILALAVAVPALAESTTSSEPNDSNNTTLPSGEQKIPGRSDGIYESQTKDTGGTGPTNQTALQKSRALEARRQGLRKLVDNQKSLLVRLVNRFDDLMRMIQSRRDKMVAAGINVSSLDTLIAKAKTQKKEADALLVTAKAKAELIQSSEDPKVAAQDFLKSTKLLRQKLEDIQKTLREISSKMKELDKNSKKSDKSEEKKPASTGATNE